jgi:hypothetical protein
MMTNDEARRALETELRSRKLVKPMTLEELNVFCGEMYKRLEFKSHSERLTDILKWAKAWQSENLPRSFPRGTKLFGGSQLAAGYNRACALLRGPELRGRRLGS